MSSELMVNEALVESLMQERDQAKKIALRTDEDEKSARASVARAEEYLAEMVKTRAEAWGRLRSINSALNSLGARDSRGRTIYDEEPNDV